MTAQNLFTMKWCAVAAMAVIAASCHTTKSTTAATSASMQRNEVRLDSAKTDEELEIELDEWYFYHDTLPLPWHRTDSSATPAAVRHLAVKRKATAASGSVKGAATVKEQVAEESSQATACGVCRIVLAAAAVVAIVATIIIARLKMWNN